jgi:hypothetical protein
LQFLQKDYEGEVRGRANNQTEVNVVEAGQISRWSESKMNLPQNG